MNEQVKKALLSCTQQELRQYVETCELPKVKVAKSRYHSDIQVCEEWDTIETVVEVEYEIRDHRGYTTEIGFVLKSLEDKFSNDDVFKPSQVGYVYFVFLDGLTKIGKATSIDRRLKQLANGGHSLDVIFVAHVPLYDKWEKFFHKLFAEKRTTGEWFHAQRADIELAKSLILKMDGRYKDPSAYVMRRALAQDED